MRLIAVSMLILQMSSDEDDAGRYLRRKMGAFLYLSFSSVFLGRERIVLEYAICPVGVSGTAPGIPVPP